MLNSANDSVINALSRGASNVTRDTASCISHVEGVTQQLSQGNVGGSLHEAGGAIHDAGRMANEIGLGSFGATLEASGVLIAKLGEILADIGSGNFSGLVRDAGHIAVGVVEAGIDGAAAPATAAANLIDLAGQLLENLGSLIGGDIGKDLGEVGFGLEELGGGIYAGLADAKGGLGNAVNNLGQELDQAGADLIHGDVAGALGHIAMGVLEAAGSIIDGVVSGLWEIVTGAASGVFHVVEGIGKLAGDAVSAFEQAVCGSDMTADMPGATSIDQTPDNNTILDFDGDVIQDSNGSDYGNDSQDSNNGSGSDGDSGNDSDGHGDSGSGNDSNDNTDQTGWAGGNDSDSSSYDSTDSGSTSDDTNGGGGGSSNPNPEDGTDEGPSWGHSQNHSEGSKWNKNQFGHQFGKGGAINDGWSDSGNPRENDCEGTGSSGPQNRESSAESTSSGLGKARFDDGWSGSNNPRENIAGIQTGSHVGLFDQEDSLLNGQHNAQHSDRKSAVVGFRGLGKSFHASTEQADRSQAMAIAHGTLGTANSSHYGTGLLQQSQFDPTAGVSAGFAHAVSVIQ